MQAHSGVNPLGAFASFMSKDPIKNMDVRRDERPPVNVETEFGFMKGKVPSGTQTYTFRNGKLTQDGRLNRENIETREPPRNKTDNVSYDPPQNNRP